jgi:hypothetical protein
MYERDFFGEEALWGGSRFRDSGSDEAASDIFPSDYDFDTTLPKKKINRKITKVSTKIQKFRLIKTI